MNWDWESLYNRQAQVAHKGMGGEDGPVDLEFASRVVRVLIEVPHTQSHPQGHFRAMELQPGGRGGTTSIKPGNIVINFGKLFDTITSGVLILAGASPWVAVLGALVVCKNLYSSSKLDITEDDASVVWALWLKSDDERTLPKSEVLGVVSVQRSKYERMPLSASEVNDSIARLIKMRCVAESRTRPDRWELRESVRVPIP